MVDKHTNLMILFVSFHSEKFLREHGIRHFESSGEVYSLRTEIELALIGKVHMGSVFEVCSRKIAVYLSLTQEQELLAKKNIPGLCVVKKHSDVEPRYMCFPTNREFLILTG